MPIFLRQLILCCLLLVAAGVLAASAIPAPTILVEGAGPNLDELGADWVMVQPNGAARCAHDEPFAYWVHRGSSNKLLVYFQGGGTCWSLETCAPGSGWYDDEVSERDAPVFSGGMLNLDHPENPFRDYTIVFIPPCTGDNYLGDNVQTYPGADGESLTIYHRGFVNANAALEWAYTNVPQPDSVFVTGCSAGSVGSIFHVPYIIEHYPHTPVTQLGESLAFISGRSQDLQTPYRGYDNFPDWIPAVQAIPVGGFEMADFYIGVADYYPTYTFAQFNSVSDRVQQRYYEAWGGQPGQFRVDLLAYLAEIRAGAPNFRTYTAAGDLHCILPDDSFYRLETGGVRLVDWVRDLAAGGDVENVACMDC